MDKWKCTVCGWIYDPAAGDPDGDIAPGTPFEKIPDSWECPVCGAGNPAPWHPPAPARGGKR